MRDSSQDRRVRYTKTVLRQSLMELMKTNDINRISVKALCELADVNRGTFYAHYDSPQDLLAQIEDELYYGLNSALFSSGSIFSESSGNVRSAVVDLMGYIAESADLCVILFGSHGDQAFLEKAMYIARDSCVEEWSRLTGDGDRTAAEYLYTYIMSGSVGIIKEWVTGGMKQSAQEMAVMIDDLVRVNILSFVRRYHTAK